MFLCFHINFPKWLLSLCMIAKNSSLDSKPIFFWVCKQHLVTKKDSKCLVLSILFSSLLSIRHRIKWKLWLLIPEKYTCNHISSFFLCLERIYCQPDILKDYSIIHKPRMLRTLSKSQVKVLCKIKRRVCVFAL